MSTTLPPETDQDPQSSSQGQADGPTSVPTGGPRSARTSRPTSKQEFLRAVVSQRPRSLPPPPCLPLQHTETAGPENLVESSRPNPEAPVSRRPSLTSQPSTPAAAVSESRTPGPETRRTVALTACALALIGLVGGSAYALWPRASDNELVSARDFHGLDARELRSRLEAAGFEVKREQRAANRGSVVVTLDVAKDTLQLSVQFHRYDVEHEAQALEETIRLARGAVRRDGGSAIVVMPGGAEAQALVAELAK